MEGEETGRKANPTDVSSRLMTQKTEDGKNKLFERSDWLTAQQIKSCFSRLSVLNKCGKLACNIDIDDDEIDGLEEALVDRQLCIVPSNCKARQPERPDPQFLVFGAL